MEGYGKEREMEKYFLDDFIDSLVIVVYKEEGIEKNTKARFIGHDLNFIFVKTLNKKLILSKNDIIKIKECEP